jgi:hypothetical protein
MSTAATTTGSAAAITHVTGAPAIVVNQSTATVRLFQAGEIIFRIAPKRHARAMKRSDTETEPPTLIRSERGG